MKLKRYNIFLLEATPFSNHLPKSSEENLKKWSEIRPGSPRRQFLAQLEIETTAIKILFTKLAQDFRKSFLKREKNGEVTFCELSTTAQSLFDFDENDIKSLQSNSNALLLEIIQKQSYVNFEFLKCVIESCGTEDEMKRVAMYANAFKEYAKKRTVEYDSDENFICDIPAGHETIMFILDKDQKPFRLIDADNFRERLSQLLGIESHKIFLQRIRHGCIIISILVSSKYINFFSTVPLFHQKMLSLKALSTQSYRLRNEEVVLNNWNILESVKFTDSPNPKIMCATINRSEFMALKYTKRFSSKLTADVGYVKYLNVFLSGKYRNLPTVKGIYYHHLHRSRKGTYLCSYPTIVLEKLKSLEDIVLTQTISPINQISLLFDISCSISSFESDQSLQISIYPDSVFVLETSDQDCNLNGRLCPLYGYSYHNIQFVSSDSHFPEPLARSKLLWMKNIVEFIHFRGKNFAKELPESHILKRMFDQKWISKKDQFRPTSYKVLCEELQHLLGKLLVAFR